jgi:hypothetical protein
MDIRSFRGLNLETCIDQIPQALGVGRIRWMFILCTQHSHGDRATLRNRLSVFKGRMGICKGKEQTAKGLENDDGCE